MSSLLDSTFSDSGQLIDAEILDRVALSTEGDLLHHALEEQQPPGDRRIFTNRTLRMDQVRFVGFDLDWTLADYDRDAMSQLAFEQTLARMVERYDYPENVLEARYRADYSRRGLMIDLEAGTVVKMNRHRYIGRAYHGRHYLGPEERARLYRREPMNPSSGRFHFLDTLFELPEVNIFAELVEMSARGTDGQQMALEGLQYDELFGDVRSAIDTIHADGSLKEKILADLPRYLPRDDQLVLALKRLALGGRRLLLITNSEWYYTDALCRHLFEGQVPEVKSWRDLFDLVIVSSGKPGFFRNAKPFLPIAPDGTPGEAVEIPEWGGVYAEGSREGLMKLLDEPGERVLYVGDHIYGDVVQSKRTSTWRTALVVSELEDELRVRRRMSSQQRHLDVLREEFIELGQRMDGLRDVVPLYRQVKLDDAAGALPEDALDRTRQLTDELRIENKVMRQQAKRIQARISRAFNPYWGSIFKQGDSKSFFGAQVDDFACLYTSRVSNFAFYGSNNYFRVLRDPMVHELEL